VSTDESEVQPRRLEPPVTETSQPFWDATREHRLLLQWCTACDSPIFFPREVCPGCLGSELEWRPASGRGRVYAVTVENLPERSTIATDAPFAVALVDLEEGVRIMSNVIGCAPDDVRVGMAVELTWEPLSDGRNLPQFEPSGGG
jgi:uncharacterized OB-fold protein